MNNREISLLAAEIADHIMSQAHNEDDYEKVLKLVAALLGVQCSCFGRPVIYNIPKDPLNAQGS